MWIWLSVGSAILLGLYDVAKKQALRRNGVLWILLVSSALTSLFLCPFLTAAPIADHLRLLVKAILVSTSWVCGLAALKTLPLTTVSAVKASRPMFVVIFSIILFNEHLNPGQWVGIALIMLALVLLGRSSKKEGIPFKGNLGLVLMIVSVLSGAASALYDKHILRHMEPLFVQSWGNVYISLILIVLLLIEWLRDRKDFKTLRWDWTLLLIAVLITIADAMYFYAVKDTDALLAVVSMVRRSSVIVTFVLGAIIFKERNIRDKALELAILMGGVAMLLFAS